MDSVTASDGMLCWDPPVYGSPYRYTLTYWDREAPPLEPYTITTPNTCARIGALVPEKSFSATVVGRDGSGMAGPYAEQIAFLAGNNGNLLGWQPQGYIIYRYFSFYSRISNNSHPPTLVKLSKTLKHHNLICHYI